MSAAPYTPSRAPSPAPAPTPSSNVRYVYLVARLRNRQITMEEATELFAIQQAMIRAAAESVTTGMMPPPPPPSPPLVPPTAPAAPRAVPRALDSDELLAMGILGVGVGVGLLAAVMRKSQENRASAPTAPTTSRDRRA